MGGKFWVKKVCLRLDSKNVLQVGQTIRRSVLLGREVFVTREPGKAMGKFFFGGGNLFQVIQSDLFKG